MSANLDFDTGVDVKGVLTFLFTLGVWGLIAAKLQSTLELT